MATPETHMTRRGRDNPVALARLTGAFYLYIIAAGIFAEAFVRGTLVNSGDAAATAANITGAESLWRIGLTAELFMLAADIFVALLLYELLKPVSRRLALLGAGFHLVSTAIAGFKSVLLLVPLMLLGGGDYLQAFGQQQIEAATLIAIKLHGQTYDISLFAFGISCLFKGYLIYRSGFLPRVLGALIVLAGLCYFANSVLNILSPEFASGLFPWIMLPCLVGEAGLTLWLLIVGLNKETWMARAQVQPA
ncbi:MAG: DUF4386 domain-containing protein [Alphaproteobacteria bacterium]|nr:DUF4386 domain-containing protein [Alphaproteobacteria bacterium]